MPISIVGGNGGSFRKPNLQIAQTMESLQLIVKSLNRSENDWWQSPVTLQSIKDMKASKEQDRQDNSSVATDSNTSVDSPFDGEGNSDDEEMIDLQASQDDQSCSSIDDDKYGHGMDGNISEDERI